MYICDYEPHRVFQFFEKISSIPHGSYHTDQLADYCLEFAAARGLKAVKDQAGNVAIFKEASPGYEGAKPVILQGHLDMVCEKKEGCPIDMEKEGITICTDGEYIWANQTTLGGDDGIALALILAILDSDQIAHPPIEALFTNNEEVGLIGAANIDIPDIQAKRLINIDSEAEGVLTVSCAGAVRVTSRIPLTWEKSEENMCALQIGISGLRGGHSGIDIGDGRQNAVFALGQALTHIRHFYPVRIGQIKGGSRVNVIPKAASAVICFPKEKEAEMAALAKETMQHMMENLQSSNEDMLVTVEAAALPKEILTEAGTKTVMTAINDMPNGVIMMNPDIPGMVRTSLNTGAVELSGQELVMMTMIRSNVDIEREMLAEKVEQFIEYLGGSALFENAYPAWQYKQESPLRNLMVMAYQEIYLNKPEIASLHAGLECGILGSRLGDMDMISFGPDLIDVHTPEEHMSIASVQRSWEYLLRVLSFMKE